MERALIMINSRHAEGAERRQKVERNITEEKREKDLGRKID